MRYFQLKSLLAEERILQAFKRPLANFEKLFDEGKSSTKSTLSLVHPCMLILDVKVFDAKIKKWSLDCGTQLTLRDWSVITGSYITSTSLLNIKLQSIKLLNRWYINPDKTKYIMKSNNSMCWKGWDTTANYIHCWWKCKSIERFWEKMCNLIREMTGFNLQFPTDCISLNCWKDDLVPNHLKQTTAILLSAAKLQIAAEWKGLGPPSLKGWCARLRQFSAMYKITDRILLLTSPTYKTTLEENWFSIISF